MSALEPGCYLDNHRGHYLTRDMIWLAEELGYRIDGDDRAMLDAYEEHSHEHDYPYEALYDLADSALDWLNGREFQFQKMAPEVPEGYVWAWSDGDFGLWSLDDLY